MFGGVVVKTVESAVLAKSSIYLNSVSEGRNAFRAGVWRCIYCTMPRLDVGLAVEARFGTRCPGSVVEVGKGDNDRGYMTGRDGRRWERRGE